LREFRCFNRRNTPSTNENLPKLARYCSVASGMQSHAAYRLRENAMTVAASLLTAPSAASRKPTHGARIGRSIELVDGRKPVEELFS
jgi:hypothetical protein